MAGLAAPLAARDPVADPAGEHVRHPASGADAFETVQERGQNTKRFTF